MSLIDTHTHNTQMPTSQFLVAVNDEEQYSLWTVDTPLPEGWHAVPGTVGQARDQCLQWVETHWKDMRPKSVKNEMAQMAQRESAAATVPGEGSAQRRPVSPSTQATPLQAAPSPVSPWTPSCPPMQLPSRMGPIPKSPWLQEFNPQPNAQVRLFCFPYLGGQAEFVKPLSKLLPNTIEVIGIQYPGHGRRMGTEDPLCDLPTFIKECSAALLPAIQASSRYAILGYSMGCFLSYETCAFLLKNYNVCPIAIFMMAQNPKFVVCTDPVLHKMSDDAIIKQLKSVGGLPDVLLQSEELLRMMLPVYRADSALSEQEVEDAYSWQAELDKGNLPILTCPIHGYAGQGEREINRESLVAWRKVTTNHSGQIRIFDGGHFFIEKSLSSVAQMLARDLVAS